MYMYMYVYYDIVCVFNQYLLIKVPFLSDVIIHVIKWLNYILCAYSDNVHVHVYW